VGRLNGLFIGGCLLLAAAGSAQTQPTCILTQITNSAQSSGIPKLDARGSRIAFAANFNPLGTNNDGSFEVFLWDAATGFTQITNSADSTVSNGGPEINAAGNRVVFSSNSDLVGNNSDRSFEIFLWDASTGLTQITNTSSGRLRSPVINALGNRVTFAWDTPLDNPDGNIEVFLWDASTGLTRITNSRQLSVASSLNATGDRIAFTSHGNHVGTSNTDENAEIFIWDATSGITQITNTVGGNSGGPMLNAAGNRIAFESNVGGIGGVTTDIYLWDASTGTIRITDATSHSASSLIPDINAAGNRIVFHSKSNLVGSNGDGNTELFLWDAATGLTQLTNTTSGSSGSASINPAGDRIAFSSTADLVGSNGDRTQEIFLATCGSLPVQEESIPAVSPLGLAALAALLGLAAAWTLRRRVQAKP
jgi:Tol biopolymer transport system component